ncbi:MAG: diguanylate cyclase [Treponema sp.]|nr:diguanylate cyclase [Treponema sp.]
MSGFSPEDPRAGYAYEYIQTVAAYAGWKCEYVYGEWENLYPALLSGEIDVLSDVSRTPEREKLLLYPDYVMGQETYYLYSNNKDANISPSDFSTWRGKKIALVKDFYQHNLFMEWQKDKNLDCEYIEFSGDEPYYNMFANHEFDLLLEIDTVAESNWNPICRIGSSDFYLAVTKSRPDLLEELNAALADVFAMNPYYNSNLWLKYFTDATISKSITPLEEEWLLRHPKINVGCMYDDLPFANYNEETEEAEGLVVEVFSHLSDTLLDKKSTFSYVFYHDTDLMFSDLQNGIIDVIAPIYRDLNYAEQADLIISEPLTTVTIGYACKKDSVFNENGNYAIPRRLRMPFYIDEHYPNLKTEAYPTYEACLNAVLAGKNDGAICNIYKMRGLVNKNKEYLKLQVSELPKLCEVAFVFARENRELFSLVNKMLSLLPSETIRYAMDTYVVKEQGYTKKTFFKEYFLYIFLSALTFVTILVSLIFALRRIREDMYFDPLTHLRNRRSLNRFIAKFLHRASEKGVPFSLILFDLDDFKYLNDTYGHAFGDQVLATTASIVKSISKRKDRAFRWGGEEFLILFNGDTEAAQAVAEQVRKEIEDLALKHEYEIVKFTVTAGVTTYKAGMTYMDLFRRVDENLYKGKNNGKNQVIA